MENQENTLRVLTEESDDKIRFAPQVLNEFGVWCSVVQDEFGFPNLTTKKIQFTKTIEEAKEILKKYLNFKIEKKISYVYINIDEL